MALRTAKEWSGRGLAPDSRGCSHCELGTPMAYFQRRYGGVIRLCIDCLMQWFPGKTAEWLEERLSHFIDHVAYAQAVAFRKQVEGPRPTIKEFSGTIPKLRHNPPPRGSF